MKQENSKYLEGLGLSRTAKDEKPFQMVKEDFLKHEEDITFRIPHDEGPEKYYYKKYMNLGKTIDESMDYDNKVTQHSSQHKFNGNIVKTSEKKNQDFQELRAIGKEGRNDRIEKLNSNSQEDKWKTGKEPNILSGRISSDDKYSKENNSHTNNYFVNPSSHLKNEGNLSIIHQTNGLNPLRMNNENYKWINNYLDQIKKEKDLEKPILNEKNNIEGINKIINKNLNTSGNSMLRTSRSLKSTRSKKKRKCYRLDKKTSENKKTGESNKLQLKDHRRVRSCDIKMEDLRESFIPNEQLSIYHPKMSLSDQFILQDTMF